ncbi:nitrate reductase, partial [Mycobacterium tuberculosis]
AGIAIVMMPWKVLETTQGYIFTWLIGYSALLGPVAGILIADYYLVRRKELDVDALYRGTGQYAYGNGWNMAAIVAFAVGVLPNIPG